MNYEKSYFDMLLPKQQVNTTLVVESFRTQGSYEIEINATIKNPTFSDKALVLIDSLEKENGNQDNISTTKTRIAYARDLLSSNPKCLELNEVLGDIQKDLDNGRVSVAKSKIEEVINACRYLTSTQDINEEKPGIITVNFDNIRNNTKLFYTIIATAALALLGIVFSMYYTNKKQD